VDEIFYPRLYLKIFIDWGRNSSLSLSIFSRLESATWLFDLSPMFTKNLISKLVYPIKELCESWNCYCRKDSKGLKNLKVDMHETKNKKSLIFFINKHEKSKIMLTILPIYKIFHDKVFFHQTKWPFKMKSGGLEPNTWFLVMKAFFVPYLT